MTGRLQLALLLGQLLCAASTSTSAGGAAAASHNAQLRAANGRDPMQADEKSWEAQSLGRTARSPTSSPGVGPHVGSAADASPGKYGKIADFFADLLGPFTRLASQAARYVAPGNGLSGLRELDESYQTNFVGVAMTFLIVAVVSALCAHFYVAHKPKVFVAEPSPDILNLSEWKTSDIINPSGWLKEKEICFVSCCCPCIRWADTIGMLGLMGFWYAFLSFLTLSYLYQISSGGLFFWLALTALCTYYRQQIRRVFDMPRGTFGTIMADCCCYCWCLPCTIAQEARHVERAVRDGVWAGSEAPR